MTAPLNPLLMPKLGLTMTEGLLAEWKVGPGDRVAKGDLLFVVETEKIANEIEAPGDGTIAEILVPAGTVVPVGTAVARWSGAAPGVADGAADEAVDEALDGAAGAAPAPEPRAPQTAGGRIRATPLARRVARERGVELARLAGSGPGGRIKAADVEAAAAEPAARPVPAGATAPPAGRRVALGPKQAAMARRVAAAKRDIPHFYISREAEVSELLDLRRRLNQDGDGRRVSVNHMIAKAVGRALAALPEANRIWADGALSELDRSDVGIVVHAEGGLFVPVLRDAGTMPLDRLADAAAELAERARRGALRAEEMEGGAISLSNLGMFEITAVVPVINPPQSAMLGVGAIREVFRPDAEGRPVLRRELTLVLACDHRVFDGVAAARLLGRVCDGLERPHSLLRTR